MMTSLTHFGHKGYQGVTKGNHQILQKVLFSFTYLINHSETLLKALYIS